MSTERELATTSTIPAASLAAAQDSDPEALKAIRAEKKARLVRILSRGYTHDRLHVELPDNVHGEWIGNDQISILEAETIGFRVDTQYASKQLKGLHDVGDGRAVIGDVIFAIMDIEDKLLHEEIRREAFELANGKPGQVKAEQREERDFATSARRTGLPVVEESRNRAARKAELEAALRRNAGSNPGTVTTGSGPVEQVVQP